jgi:hypothetical protein
MRLYLALLAGLLLAGCTKENGPQRLDFVNTTRYTSSNRVGLNPADTLASRIFAENKDQNGPNLGRLVVTVRYQPRRNPFVYPTPISSVNRDSIDKSTEGFVFLDSTLAEVNAATGQLTYPGSFLLTTTFGVRTTTGTERWEYDLYSSASLNSDPTARRAVRLSMRRPDSTAIYNDYLLRLVIPAVGVNPLVRAKSSRRFLHLRAGLALPAYTVVRAGAPDPATQGVAQRLTDLIILADGLTLVSPNATRLTTITSPATAPGLSDTRWPSANRRKTLIYPTNLTATTYASQTDDAAIQALYRAAASTATAGQGQFVGPVAAGQVYVFRTDEITDTATPATPYRYGLLLVASIPTSTTATSSAGLQLQVRMAK